MLRRGKGGSRVTSPGQPSDASREQFASQLRDHLSALVDDAGFEGERNQIRSKAILSQLSPESAVAVEYRYDPVRVVRNAELILLALEGQLPEVEATDDVRELGLALAETFEHLASLGEGVNRVGALLRAALLYQLAGYQANATCIAREVELPSLDFTDSPPFATDLLVRWTFLLLRRQAVLLLQETRKAESNLSRVQDSLLTRVTQREENVQGVVSWAEGKLLQETFSGLAKFCLRGEESELEIAFDRLDILLGLYQRTGGVIETSYAAGLRSLSQAIRDRSTWTWLNGDRLNQSVLWRRYLQLLARGQHGDPRDARGVFELWPSQISAVQAGILGADTSFVVQMPTSAGKTRIAELIILDTFARHEDAKCVYVAPYRALADQVERDLTTTFADLGFRVSSVLGSFELDDFQDFLLMETDLLVTTPEKLDLLYRARPEFFDDVQLIVLDEGHLVDDATRGVRYELLITKLRRKLRERNARFLFLSAVMSEDNLTDFATWLCDNPERTIATTWRPTRQLLGKFTWRGSNGELRYGDAGPFVPNLIYPREYTDYTPKQRREKIVPFPDTTSRGETAAELAIKFAEQGSVLVFTTRPDWVDSIAGRVLRGLTLRRQSGMPVPTTFRDNLDTASIEAAIEWLGEDHLVTQALRRGVAVHYGPLPEAVRRAIEADYKAGYYPVMIATNTLAQGVNLPIKTVIVHSTTRGTVSEETGEWERAEIPVRDFWNICGRAGRAGVDTAGQIVFIVMTSRDAQLFDYYSDRGNTEPVKGRLFEVLERLRDNRISDEEFRDTLDSDILSILVEEVVGTPEQAQIERILDSSLVRIEAQREGWSLEPLVQKTTELVHSIWSNVPDEDRRKVFARTGLRLASCQDIWGHVEENAGRVRELLQQERPSAADLVALLLNGTASLKEMQSQYSFDAPIHQMLTDWVSGVPFDSLVDSYAVNERDVQRMSRFIEDYFSFRLPWGFSAYIRIATHQLGLDDEALSNDLRYFTSMVKFGVDSPESCWAMSVGVPTRELATVLAAAYVEDVEEAPSFANFVGWLSSLSEDDLAQRFEISHHKLEYMMAKIAGLSPVKEELHQMLVTTGPTQANVVGLMYEGRLSAAMRVNEGDLVDLVRDYGNPYDRNAILVRHEQRALGYVERALARLLGPQIDAGVEYEAQVVEKRLSARPPRMRLRLSARS